VAYPVSPYIEERNGGLYIAGRRVTLDSVVINYQEGASPAKIVECFPTLKLWQVYGALAYYLENEQVIGQYIAEAEREFERLRALNRSDPERAALYARLEAARQEMVSKRT
jgi:uncharacterized protein (DUF433 family)